MDDSATAARGFTSSLDEALDTAFDVHQDDSEEAVVSGVAKVPETTEQAPVEPVVPSNRDGSGRFQKKLADMQGEQGPQLDPPQFWKADKKALFAKAPRDVQEAILEHENQRVAWANQQADKYMPANKRYAELDETFRPYERQWAKEGLRPADVVKRLVTWQEDFDNPETRVEALTNLLASYDLTPQDLIPQDYGQEQGYPGYSDPRVDVLHQEISSLREELTQKEQNTVLESVQNEVAGWMSETDSNGQLLRPQASFYEPQMAQGIQALMENYPGRSAREYLDTAYEHLMGYLGQGNGTPAPTNGIAEAKERQDKARAASSSVRGAPDAATARAKPKGIDEALDMAFKMHGAS